MISNAETLVINFRPSKWYVEVKGVGQKNRWHILQQLYAEGLFPWISDAVILNI